MRLRELEAFLKRMRENGAPDDATVTVQTSTTIDAEILDAFAIRISWPQHDGQAAGLIRNFCEGLA